jgi:hypothetical protein
MKKSLLTGFLALVISAVFASVGMAQQSPAATQPSPAQAKMEKFNGLIEKVDAVNKEFVAQFHKESITFSVGEHTKFMEATKALPFSHLKEGMWASIEYQKEGNKWIANSVNVSTPKVNAKHLAMARRNEAKMGSTTMSAPYIPNMTEDGWKMTHDVSKMLGAGVTNRDGKEIAKVKDFVMDRHSRIAFAILSYREESEMENLVAVPYSILFYNEANKEYFTDLTKERLASAPKIHDTGDLAGHQFASEVYRYFGIRPYWESAKAGTGKEH